MSACKVCAIGLAAIGMIGYSVAAAAQTPQPREICPADLPDRINQIIAAEAFDQARWGVLVQTLHRQPDQRQTLVDRDGQKLFIPASTAKLLTTAAALQHLGPRYRIRTSVLGEPSPNGRWQLQVIGRGDPSLEDAQLQQLAQQLKQRGITQVEQLWLDDRYFGNNQVNPTWEWGDLQSGYGSIAHSLIVNLNYHSLTLTPQQVGQPLKLHWNHPSAIANWRIENQTHTVGANTAEFVSISRDLSEPILRIRGQLSQGAAPEVIDLATLNPQQVFRDRLVEALTQVGITVEQVEFANTDTDQLPQEVAFVESPTLAELIQQTNRESDNLYAEVLLQTIGATANRNPQVKLSAEDNTTTAGLKVLQQTLAQLGIDRRSYQLSDGAGLARMNFVSPAALVQTLQAMLYQPSGIAYRSSLPIASQTGTLTNRFRGTAAAAIVQAKTGTLTGALGLSGYISPHAYEPLAFSILLNQSLEPNATQRTAIDQIVVVLAQLKRC